jgi:multidrug transporter EmrE-like cation transporter
MRLFDYLFLFLLIALSVAGQYFLKRSVSHFSFEQIDLGAWLRMMLNPGIMLWVALTAGTVPLWMILTKRFELSFLYPAVMSLTFVFVLLMSIFVFSEQASALRWLGILLAMVGVYLASL